MIPVGAGSADPAVAAVWEAVSPGVAAARVRLGSHGTTPDIAVTRTRSRLELKARRAELQTILATVPADHRPLIARLQAGETLPLEDPAELLREALAGQGERRSWSIGRTLSNTPKSTAPSPTVGEAGLVTLAGQSIAPDGSGIDPVTETSAQ
ncbi:MAG TPA: hypothetical protein VFI47_13570 [Acidimicrobiales bacterium]|nr:hypothetical protein [Acidimicrobiales bacterium]